jgi:hypothetical protein
MKCAVFAIGFAAATLTVVLVVGCTKASARGYTNATESAAKATGSELYERVSSSAFQLNSAVQALTDALAQLPKDGSEKSIEGLINRAGETIGDYPVAPKSEREVDALHDHYVKWCAEAHAAAERALKIVLDAESALAASDPENSHAALADSLRTAEDALHGAMDNLSEKN